MVYDAIGQANISIARGRCSIPRKTFKHGEHEHNIRMRVIAATFTAKLSDVYVWAVRAFETGDERSVSIKATLGGSRLGLCH